MIGFLSAIKSIVYLLESWTAFTTPFANPEYTIF